MNEQPKPTHAEAFCLMQYQNLRTGEIEILWNSRDGVTPFCIPSRDGHDEMRHINWRQDVRAPEHKPEPGQRVFVDLTKERATEVAKKRVELHWDQGEYPMSKSFSTKEEAITVLTRDLFGSGGEPDIAVLVPALDPLEKVRTGIAKVFSNGAGAMLNELCDLAFENSRGHGWWDGVRPGDEKVIPEKIALLHSELSEMLEDYRSGRMVMVNAPDGKPCGFPSEVADVFIRLADLCGHLQVDLGQVVLEKMAFNLTRPHRHGGKAC